MEPQREHVARVVEGVVEGADLRAARDGAALRTVAYLFGGYLVSSLVFGWMFRALDSPVLEVAETVCTALLTTAFAAGGFAQLQRFLDPTRLRLGHVGLVLAVAAVWLPVFGFYFAVFEAAGVPMLRMTDTMREAGWPLWVAFVTSSIAPAVFEELAFRGVIFGRLERVLSAREALVVQAALFSVAHLLPLIFVSHFAMGYALGWLRTRTGSLYPGMLVHGAWNALVICQELRTVP